MSRLMDSDDNDCSRLFVDAPMSKRSKKADQVHAQHAEGSSAKNPPNLVGPQTIVTIHVTHESGESRTTQPFRAHKNYICHYSAYFDAAFNGNFSEGLNQELSFDDVEPTVFGMFVNWTYAQTIVNEEGDLPGGKDLAMLWVLADRIIAPNLANDAILALNEQRIRGGGRLSSSFFKYIYDNTNDESPLRHYIIDACSKGTLGLIKNGSKYPHQLLIDIINTGRTQDKLYTKQQGVWKPSQLELRLYFVPDIDPKK